MNAAVSNYDILGHHGGGRGHGGGGWGGPGPWAYPAGYVYEPPILDTSYVVDTVVDEFVEDEHGVRPSPSTPTVTELAGPLASILGAMDDPGSWDATRPTVRTKLPEAMSKPTPIPWAPLVLAALLGAFAANMLRSR